MRSEKTILDLEESEENTGFGGTYELEESEFTCALKKPLLNSKEEELPKDIIGGTYNRNIVNRRPMDIYKISCVPIPVLYPSQLATCKQVATKTYVLFIYSFFYICTISRHSKILLIVQHTASH